MANPQTVPADNRQARRFYYTTLVRVEFQTARQIAQCITQNVSEGGLFLRMDDPSAAGDWLFVELTLPDGETVTVRGKVVYVVSPEDALRRGLQPGVGVRFVSLTEEQRRFIVELVDDAEWLAEVAASPLTNGAVTLPQLREELTWLRDHREPLFDASTREDLRSEYLERLSHWHPNRFVFEPAEVREIVAEICIEITSAYRSCLAAMTRLDTESTVLPVLF